VGVGKGREYQDSYQVQQMNEASITERGIRRLLQKQGFRCALTGRELTTKTASLDHMQPLGRGGEHSIGNVQLVHSQVNAAKGTMTTEEFVALCHEVVRHAETKPEAGTEANSCSEDDLLPLFARRRDA